MFKHKESRTPRIIGYFTPGKSLTRPPLINTIEQIVTTGTVIAGACNAGVDSLFITGGIHAKDLSASSGETDEQKLLELFQLHDGQPTYSMPALQI